MGNAVQGARLGERFQQALMFAAKLHNDQTRKQTQIPYVSHLLAVCSLVLEAGGTEDEAIAALLHDAAEDQGGQATLEIIRERFGDSVAKIVAACTDTFEEPKPEWKPRKERYLAHLPTEPRSVRIVSSADKLHNARAILADYRIIGDALWQRFNGGKEGTLWYYKSLVEAYRLAGHSPLVDELDRVVSALERMAG